MKKGEVMSDILSYFGEIIILTAVSGILFMVAPEGNVKKYINFAISICILAAIVAPMISAVVHLPESIRYEEEAWEDVSAENFEDIENAVVKASKDEIEQAICSYICAKYGYTKGRVTCEIELDARDISNIEITTIALVLPPSENEEKIQRELEEMFLGRSTILVSEEEQ